MIDPLSVAVGFALGFFCAIFIVAVVYLSGISDEGAQDGWGG